MINILIKKFLLNDFHRQKFVHSNTKRIKKNANTKKIVVTLFKVILSRNFLLISLPREDSLAVKKYFTFFINKKDALHFFAFSFFFFWLRKKYTHESKRLNPHYHQNESNTLATSGDRYTLHSIKSEMYRSVCLVYPCKVKMN